MSHHLLALRPYTNPKTNQIELAENWYPGAAFATIEDLIKKSENFINYLPPSERYNLFYTLCDVEFRDRKKFINAQYIGFDIDDISYTEKEAYLEPIAIALKIDLNKCLVVFTGNGIQIVVKLEKPYGIELFKHKELYNLWCKRISHSLDACGLPHHADPVVFEPRRIFRLPGTVNLKPMKDPDNATMKNATLRNGTIEFCGFDFFSITVPDKKTLEYPRPNKTAIMAGCEFLKFANENQATLTEPMWSAAIGITAYIDSDLSHAISKGHPKYTFEETQTRHERVLNELTGPRKCESINQIWGGCNDCPHFNQITSPLQIKPVKNTVQKDEKPSEMSVVKMLLNDYNIKFDANANTLDSKDGTLIKHENELFEYNGKFWEMLPDAGTDSVKRRIMSYYNMKATCTKIESTFKLFKTFVPSPPPDVNMFASNPNIANFENGSLRCYQDENGKFQTGWHPHRKEDYLLNLIPGEFSLTHNGPNTLFEKLLEDVFKNDADKDQKIRAIGQMYGAALIPIFPHIFFVHGVAGSGKSTLLLILREMLSSMNVCSVQPHQFHGFHMESMPGKLVNIVTDVKVNAPVDDDIIKQIEDRIPQRVQRKNRADVYAPLPSLHLFGGNGIPKTFEGASRAHNRRWTFIQFNNELIQNDAFTKNYAAVVFNSNPQGIIDFAIKGLLDLISLEGHFTKIDSGTITLNKWQSEYDTFQNFIDDFGEGCLNRLSLSEDAIASRTEMWNFFQAWQIESGRKFSKVTRNQFYKHMEQKGHVLTRRSHGRFLLGINIEPLGNSNEQNNVAYPRF